MAKPFREWTVLPHGKLTRLDDKILTVTGLMKMPPMGEVERRMTIVRLVHDGLIVHSAIALGEAEMSALEALGPPTYLIVPNEIHRMDARIWKDRYPKIQVVTPAGARDKVEKIVPVDATDVDFGDPAVFFVTVPGTGERESALIVESDSGTTLVMNDLIFNLENRPGLSGWLFEKIGITGDEPHIPPVVRRRLVEDKSLLKAQLEIWSRIPDLNRLIISHGGIIGNDARSVLGRIARDLAA